MFASIFLDFSLPNAATWFYFSFLLANAVFFKFDRLLSLRNWDLLTLYLLVPGLLLVMEAHSLQAQSPADGLLLAGYIWLLVGTAYLFARCLFDLGLERRPNFTPNLNTPGLVCFGIALLVCLGAVAIRRMPESPDQVGRGSVALTRVKDGATAVVERQGSSDDAATLGVDRFVAIALHLSITIALVLIGHSVFRDLTTGVGMACLYLILPYTAYHVSQIHHIWPVAFILWAVYAYRRPAASGALLGVAAGTAFFPVLLFPLWFGFYRGRGAGRFTLGFLSATALGLAVTATMLLASGDLYEYLNTLLRLSDWQPWKVPKTEGIWHGSHWAYRLPVFIVYIAFVVLTMFWPTPRNLAQVIAQTAAVVIGIQFWYADQGGVYVLWYLPLVLLMVFRPNLSEVRPPLPDGSALGVISMARRLVGRVSRRGRPSSPAGQAA